MKWHGAEVSATRSDCDSRLTRKFHPYLSARRLHACVAHLRLGPLLYPLELYIGSSNDVPPICTRSFGRFELLNLVVSRIEV